MSQNRDNLPWFPLYANNLISDKRYRQMTPLERALWISILLECWSNRSVPADLIALAKWLGWSEEDARAGLTERVRSFFDEVEGELISPQLEEHYKKQMKRRTGLSEGGKKGAGRRWKKVSDKDEIASPLTSPLTSPIARRIASFNTIKSNSFKSNSVSRKEKVKDAFVDEMEAYEAASNQGSAIV